MKLWLRAIILLILIEGLVSSIWFLLGATHYFQRGLDLIATAYFAGLAIPMLILILVFTYLLAKKWTPRDKEQRRLLYTLAIINTLFAVVLVGSLYTEGWTNTYTQKDSLQMTDDQKYEYQIELVNLFQRNSYAQLHLRRIESNMQSSIRIDMNTNDINALGVGKINHWIELKSTASSGKYILRTTEDLGIPEESFMIDMSTQSAQAVD